MCSLVTKLFVAGGAGVIGEVVCSVGLAWGVWWPQGAPWWNGVDWSSIHVGSRRKAYRVRNDFLNLVVPELFGLIC